MKKRCYDPKNPAYKNYGGRGITYDPRWNDFNIFCDDMGLRPRGTSLERLDNAGPYQKGNVVWATVLEQNRNKRKQTQPSITSTTGILGISKHSTSGKWVAQGYRNGRVEKLYYGDNLELAIQARKTWEESRCK